MAQANYTYTTVEADIKFLLIEDLDIGGKSVTNDIENVCNEIQQKLQGNILTYVILYKDSMGHWDQYNIKQNTFRFLNAKTSEEAIIKYLKLL